MENCMVESAIIMNEAAEARWQEVALINAADREFKRSRRKARYRRLLRRLGMGRVAEALFELQGEGEFRFDLEGIAGMADAEGKPQYGLPPMPRGMMRKWRELYSRLGTDDEDWSFSLRPHSGAWYLEGGSLALARIEILRMRGEESIMAKASSFPDRCDCESLPEEGCCEGDLGAA
jgi:hypothetical protein